jgi:hypothetical protein
MTGSLEQRTEMHIPVHSKVETVSLLDVLDQCVAAFAP